MVTVKRFGLLCRDFLHKSVTQICRPPPESPVLKRRLKTSKSQTAINHCDFSAALFPAAAGNINQCPSAELPQSVAAEHQSLSAQFLSLEYNKVDVRPRELPA